MKQYLVKISTNIKIEAENNTVAVWKAAEMVRAQEIKANMFYYDEKEIEEVK